MAITLNVSDSTSSYNLNIHLDGTGSNLLAPPRPPLESGNIGAFDAALIQYKPTDESDIKDDATTPVEDYLLNDRYYTKSFNVTDEELKQFYIPLH